MRTTILILLLAITASTFCNAQEIEVEKIFGGYKYSQNDTVMSMGDLVKVMESNSQALGLIKKAKTNNTVGAILAGIGGGLVGFPIGTAIRGDDPNWTLAGIGVGVIALTIPLNSGVHKNIKQAVEIYNSSLNATTSNNFNPEFKIIANGNGVGLTMRF